MGLLGSEAALEPAQYQGVSCWAVRPNMGFRVWWNCPLQPTLFFRHVSSTLSLPSPTSPLLGMPLPTSSHTWHLSATRQSGRAPGGGIWAQCWSWPSPGLRWANSGAEPMVRIKNMSYGTFATVCTGMLDSGSGPQSAT